MPDLYGRFDELAAAEREGRDFRIDCDERPSPVAIIAPHGGEIEPGTSEIAAAIAGDRFSLYRFEGLRARPHGDLHITSNRFDEPRCCALVARSAVVVTVHGRGDDDDPATVWVGGRDMAARSAIAAALIAAGFSATTSPPRLEGKSPQNICNRGSAGQGIQLEIPRTLRDRLRASGGAAEMGRFAAAIRDTVMA
jgi:phage replication-related protein YjqB (UPF0714/DUF867 family)